MSFIILLMIISFSSNTDIFITGDTCIGRGCIVFSDETIVHKAVFFGGSTTQETIQKSNDDDKCENYRTILLDYKETLEYIESTLDFDYLDKFEQLKQQLRTYGGSCK